MQQGQSSAAVAQERIKAVVCQDRYYLQYRTWTASTRPAATAVLVNGMISHTCWFRELARELAICDLHVVGADRRGSGLNGQARGDAPSRQILVDDLLRIVEQERDENPVYLVGWCWGALLTVNAALEFSSRLSGLALLAPALFPSRSIKDAARREIMTHAHEPTEKPCLTSPVTETMFSDQQRIRDFILQDRLAQRFFSRRFFDISGEMSFIASARLSQLRLPVLLLLASYDETVDGARTLKELGRLQRVLITTLACNHGMPFEVPKQLAASIVDWIITLGAPVPRYGTAS